MADPRPAKPRRMVLYARDAEGTPYAVEEVAAERWDASLAAPPDAESADVRIVRLARGPLPATTPPWLHAEVAARVGARVAETGAGYAVGNAEGGDAERTASAASAGAALWPWSPSYRPPRTALEEFLYAGATRGGIPTPCRWRQRASRRR